MTRLELQMNGILLNVIVMFSICFGFFIAEMLKTYFGIAGWVCMAIAPFVAIKIAMTITEAVHLFIKSTRKW